MIHPISTYGKVGQTVICFGQKSDSKLSQYTSPTIFTIVEKKDGKDGYYMLADSNNNTIKVQSEYYGASTCDFYDAQKWLTWIDAENSRMSSISNKEIEKLENNVALLKEILIKQGIHIVTEEQAKNLDI